MNTKNLSGVIKSAKRVDKVMTGIMYAVGGFFLVLLIVMAGYIIIKGILDFSPAHKPAVRCPELQKRINVYGEKDN